MPAVAPVTSAVDMAHSVTYRAVRSGMMTTMTITLAVAHQMGGVATTTSVGPLTTADSVPVSSHVPGPRRESVEAEGPGPA